MVVPISLGSGRTFNLRLPRLLPAPFEAGGFRRTYKVSPAMQRHPSLQVVCEDLHGPRPLGVPAAVHPTGMHLLPHRTVLPGD